MVQRPVLAAPTKSVKFGLQYFDLLPEHLWHRSLLSSMPLVLQRNMQTSETSCTLTPCHH